MKRILVTLLKIGVPITLIWWVVNQADERTWRQMVEQPKNWKFLVLALCTCMTCVLLSYIRWYFLVRALDLPFRLRDAFRLGFLGYMFNFVSLGAVGGDLFKAFFIAREQKERRAEAVATVVIDRIVGLYALLVLATFAILLTDAHKTGVAQIRDICYAAFICTGVGAIGILALLIPGFTTGVVSNYLSNLPHVGRLLERLIGAIRMYRQRFGVVLLAGIMSLGIHSLMALGLFFIAEGLPGRTPTLRSHFILIPLAALTGALPLPAAGLGAFEFAVDKLYVTYDAVVKPGQGLLVALTYRMITVVIALIGWCYYVRARKELADLVKAAKAEEQME